MTGIILWNIHLYPPVKHKPVRQNMPCNRRCPELLRDNKTSKKNYRLKRSSKVIRFTARPR